MEPLIERLYWLIRLRWIAAAGVVLTVLLANLLLKFSLPLFPLFATVILLSVYNLVFFLFLKSSPAKESRIVINRIANTQIALDLLSLS
ncbi:MAG: sensor histidine kinase, partial [Candidatus Omnitrophota bacterium]